MPLTPFDTLVISPKLQMMKLMLPYTPASSQRLLAFYIKFTELQNTIHYFKSFESLHDKDSFSDKPEQSLDILEDLRPYMSTKDSETIDMIMTAMNMMEMMNQSDMPDLSSMGDISSMMGMMNMFGGGFTDNDSFEETDNDNNETQKGNDDGRMDESPRHEEY